VLVAALAVSVGVFARRTRLLAALVRMGRPVARTDHVATRVRNEAVIVLAQRKLFQRLAPGLMHAFIFWGFLVLFPTIVHAMGALIDPDFALPVIGGTRWFALVVDVFATLVAVGVGLAFFIRKLVRPKRFEGSHLREADFILLAILGIVATLLLWNADRIALGLNEAPAAWSPVANLLSGLFGRGSEATERALVWAHVLIILGFLTYIPHSKHLHIVTAAINVFFGKTGPRGRLEPLRIDLEAPEEEIRFGAATVSDLTWKEVVDLYSCTECGRCQDACPASFTGKALSPKLLIMDLRDHLFEEGPNVLSARAGGEDHESPPLVPTAVTDEVVWDCVTCGACVRECPVSIEHIDHIVDLRRNLVMAESRFPQEAGALLRNLESSSNPWGQPQAQRAAWADGLEVRVLEPGESAPEYLFWVGCAASFDDRARNGARALVRLLNSAGIDFAILGPRELCTGDPARRMGHEYLFQTLAEQNVETLDGAGVRKIVASCPHCFNTLTNEYPDYGGRFEVVHHTELLARLVRDGRLAPPRVDGRSVTYHDPCYLGRHNGIYDEPRSLVPSSVEMPRHGERSFCCGAGGARMWMEERVGRQIADVRVEEAADTGADTLAVACPYCMIMLDDGTKSVGKDLDVKDVAQLMAESLE